MLDEFRAARTDSLRLVRSLTAMDLDRGGYHPEVGYVRVRDLLHEWLHHDATPYGFRYIPKAERSAYEEMVRRGEAPPHTNGWVIVPEEAAVVRRIFESLASGMTMHALTKDLTRDGIPTPRGKRTWSVPTIHGILRNPAMWGKAAHGRTTQVKPRGADEGKRRTVRQDKDKVIHGRNPAIVTEELAELA